VIEADSKVTCDPLVYELLKSLGQAEVQLAGCAVWRGAPQRVENYSAGLDTVNACNLEMTAREACFGSHLSFKALGTERKAGEGFD
jgi:hypothetical protein